MTGELYINGKDAYTQWGVNMGDGFLETLLAPLTYKDMISNESAKKHGTEYYVEERYFAERTLTLPFVIIAGSSSLYNTRLQSFLNELYTGRTSGTYKGYTDISVSIASGMFHLIYQGDSGSYARSKSGKSGKISVKFIEPNPNNR